MAVYYYYLASLARAPLGPGLVETGAGPRPPKEVIAEDLLGRQREDGSWANPVGATREDEPLIATSFALLALA
jgi:hypothetical protein